MLSVDVTVQGMGNYTGEAQLAVYPVNGAPSLYQASANSNGVSLSWEELPGANGYTIYRKKSGGQYEKVMTIPSNAQTSWTDPQLKNAQGTYTYAIDAYLWNGTKTLYTGKSNEKTVSLYAGSSKIQLIAAYNGAYGIGTKWIKLSGATEYTIWQKYNGVWRAIKTVKANDSSLQASGNTLMYTDQTVKKGYGKGYIYSVSAKVGNKTVEYDRAGVAIYRLNPPTLRKATNSKAGTATVTWKGVFGKTETNGAYDLQYSTEADAKAGKWTSVPQKLGNTTTSTTITGLKKGTKYMLRIRCSKTNKDRGTFYSEYSKWLSVTIKK